jgi:hypothetical protein
MIKRFLYWLVPDAEWIGHLWAHHYGQLTNEQVQPVSSWACIRATIAIILRREDHSLVDFRSERFWNGEEIAWAGFGEYWTDYGVGKSWDYLKVDGFSYAIGSDGSL